ncbi:PulJ/GspJ family protein [Verrucomicrobium spinosum]|uniref:PulJ/GspJ family protein n=1 Tax=Verrucomicrobium spinosum TaxID=2736 RepID=UPI0022B6AD59|nr:prepilin-type N-terminal cleavage/methylation domain-containing protein [Verrucomicrobium spinosum]
MFTRNRPNPAATSRASAGGFTLLEMIMALTLLALLSGMVFGIVRVSVRTAVDTRQIQQENDEVNRYVALCRHMFQNLPVTAILSLKVTETATPPIQELTISGAPEAFSYGYSPMSYKDTILGIRPDYAATESAETNPQGTRLYYLGLSREDIIPTQVGQSAGVTRAAGDGLAAPDDQGRYWMPLLSGVVSLNWRFYKQDEDVWEEEWEDTDLPPLVEMNLLLKDRTLPLRAVFALPTTKLTEANAALRPSTSSSSSTQTGGGNNNNAGGGGNNNQGGGDRGGRGGGDRGGRGGGGGRDGGGQGQGQGGQGQGGQGQGQGGQRGGGGGPRGGGGGGGASGNSGGGAQPSGGGGGSTGGGR